MVCGDNFNYRWVSTILYPKGEGVGERRILKLCMPEFSLFKTFCLQEAAVIYIQKKAQCYTKLRINKTTKEISKINSKGRWGKRVEGLGRSGWPQKKKCLST